MIKLNHYLKIETILTSPELDDQYEGKNNILLYEIYCSHFNNINFEASDLILNGGGKT